MEKKILVAVDGSVYSSNALCYLGHLFTGLEDIHFHLLSILPAGSLPPGRDWLDDRELKNILPAAARRRYDTAKGCLNNCKARLARYGIPDERLTTAIRIAGQGVAADIMGEATQGIYDALVVGRRGISKLAELIMGSVSSTILEKCHDSPVWIIDGHVDSRKFLVPVDGTIHSLLAVDHLAFILAGNPHAEVTLFHCPPLFGRAKPIRVEDFYDQWDKEWCDCHLSRPDSLYHAPEQLLLESGFPAGRVRRIEARDIDPSRQILQQALIKDFGTIVMGRRGGDVNKGLLKGVTDRVMLMAEDVAIWVVG